jgi:hypothetical protein
MLLPVEFGVALRVVLFRFELISSCFDLFFKINSIMHMHMQHMTHVGPIRPSPKEKFAQYIRRTYSRW